jgi:NADH dehydrogenase
MIAPLMSQQLRVVIIGGGFGGLYAARALKRAPVQITLLDRSNHHCFQPLLYQVATAGLAATQIAAPIRKIFGKQANVRVELADVDRIDPDARTVVTADQTAIPYDFLIVATGATHAYFGNDHWAPHAPGLKTLGDAIEIRRRVLLAFEAAERQDDPALRDALMTFVVVGGGPTGVELAGALAEVARHTLEGEFRSIDPATAKVILLEAGDRVLASFDEKSSQNAHRQLEDLGAVIRLGARVTNIDADGVMIGDEALPARTVLWAAGVAASPLAASLDTDLDRAGRVKVAPDLTVPGRPEIFVVGDLALVEQDGKSIPGVAPAAIQGGTYAGRAIRARLENPAAEVAPFRYVDKGSLATIGRSRAVAEVGGRRFGGLLAWLLWAVVHLMYLTGFRNRLVTFMDWTWSYLSWSRGARVVLEGESVAGRRGAPMAQPIPEERKETV